MRAVLTEPFTAYTKPYSPGCMREAAKLTVLVPVYPD
jgi:hypothetical protein